MLHMTKILKFGALSVIICLGLLASSANATIVILTPDEPGQEIAAGDLVEISWSGADGTNHLQLWRGWQLAGATQDMWEIVDNGAYIPDTDDSYVWDSTGSLPGLYAFGAWVEDASGQWYKAEAPGYLVIPESSTNDLVEIYNPGIDGVVIVRDPIYIDIIPGDYEEEEELELGVASELFPIRWTGGADGSLIQLWAGTTPDDWFRIDSDDVDSASGEYVWDTSQLDLGTYFIGAWVQNGTTDEWYEVDAPGTLDIVQEQAPEPATMSVLVIGAIALLRRRRA